MREFILNGYSPDNYMFIAKDAELYLDITCRKGVAEKITPDIQRGLDSGVIIDVTKEPIKPPPTPPEVEHPLPTPPEESNPDLDTGDEEVSPTKKTKKSGK